MRNNWRTALVLLVIGLAAGASAALAAGDKTKPKADAKNEPASLFGLTKVHAFHIELAAKE